MRKGSARGGTLPSGYLRLWHVQSQSSHVPWPSPLDGIQTVPVQEPWSPPPHAVEVASDAVRSSACSAIGTSSRMVVLTSFRQSVEPTRRQP